MNYLVSVAIFYCRKNLSHYLRRLRLRKVCDFLELLGEISTAAILGNQIVIRLVLVKLIQSQQIRMVLLIFIMLRFTY